MSYTNCVSTYDPGHCGGAQALLAYGVVSAVSELFKSSQNPCFDGVLHTLTGLDDS